MFRRFVVGAAGGIPARGGLGSWGRRFAFVFAFALELDPFGAAVGGEAGVDFVEAEIASGDFEGEGEERGVREVERWRE